MPTLDQVQDSLLCLEPCEQLWFCGYRCSVIYGTPTMFIDMINHPDFDKYDLSSVKEGETDLFDLSSRHR